MKRTLLFALALIAVGCAEGEQEESASCADLSEEWAAAEDGMSPLEDVRSCAEHGDAVAQTNLGLMYMYGRGVPEDDAEAVRWYQLAAEQGYASAQFSLGFMYYSGEGVRQDNVLAYMWLNLAAAQGNGFARDHKEIVERQMTREEIAEAERMSREWLEAHPGGN